jgi:hypothetical protein
MGEMKGRRKKREENRRQGYTFIVIYAVSILGFLIEII